MSKSNGRQFEKGFIPVMLMPFSDKGEIDYKGLTELTEFYIQSGAVGLFANCLSSEMYDLTPGEQIKSTRHIINVVNNRVPVVATGNFGATVSKQADFMKAIYDTGVEAVIIITSLLASEQDSEEVFSVNAMELMDLTGNIPVGFYECPVPYKRILTPRELSPLLNTNRVVYYKDTCLDIKQVQAKIAAANGFDFRLYDAYLGHAIESLRSGADGLSCIQGNFFPEIIVWFCRNYNNPELSEEVEKVQAFLIANMDVMHNAYPTVAKYFLQKRRMKISTFSRTSNGMTDPVKLKIDKLFSEYTNLKAELGL